MQTVTDIITSLGGTSKVAASLGIPPQTVSSWKAANSIPNWRQDSINELLRKKERADAKAAQAKA